MTSTDNVVEKIDSALDMVVRDLDVSRDAMRVIPAGGVEHQFPVLLIPASTTDPVRIVDLLRDTTNQLQAFYHWIGCDLIEVLSPADGIDLIFDEEGSPLCKTDAVLNTRATYLAHNLKFAQVTGEYPAPAGVRRRDLIEEAVAWERQIRLYGAVVVAGFDASTGEHLPVPAAFIAYASEALQLDLD